MDESNVLDSSFLERMNTLLANGEVPGLFEGDEYSTLMTGCKEGAVREGLMLDSAEELYKWFTQQVCCLKFCAGNSREVLKLAILADDINVFLHDKFNLKF